MHGSGPIHVLIVDDDFYARDALRALAARDARTRVWDAVESISAMGSEVMGCTTERSACGRTTEVMMVMGCMPRLRAASICPPSTVLMPVRATDRGGAIPSTVKESTTTVAV